ncbi:hypothetical protein GH721_18565 [Kriegella sp. EG-1]|nr:hypothetical protein [Flavobacteriaceae bacterium EG-1]
MNFSKSLLPVSCFLIILFACKNNLEETKPSKRYEGIEKMKKKHKEIDSINSLKNKKHKEADSLKPGLANL